MGKIHSKDPKLKKEIESARLYSINWDSKRFDLLRKNMDEMLLAYPKTSIPILNSARKALGANYLAAQNYKANRLAGYGLATVYGDPESFMAHNPNSPYTRRALDFAKEEVEIFKNNVTPEDVFDDAVDFDGLTFGSYRFPRIYVRNGLSGLAAHEFWHAGSQRTNTTTTDAYAGGSYKSNPHHFAVVKYLKQDPYIKNLLTAKRLDWDKPVTETGYLIPNYMWNPDEVLARRAALMHYLNWDPTKKATLKDVQEWRRKGLLGDGEKPIKNNPIFYTTPFVSFDKLSDETILHLINDVALNNTISKPELVLDVYYAYKGGLINKLTR